MNPSSRFGVRWSNWAWTLSLLPRRSHTQGHDVDAIIIPCTQEVGCEVDLAGRTAGLRSRTAANRTTPRVPASACSRPLASQPPCGTSREVSQASEVLPPSQAGRVGPTLSGVTAQPLKRARSGSERRRRGFVPRGRFRPVAEPMRHRRPDRPSRRRHREHSRVGPVFPRREVGGPSRPACDGVRRLARPARLSAASTSESEP